MAPVRVDRIDRNRLHILAIACHHAARRRQPQCHRRPGGLVRSPCDDPPAAPRDDVDPAGGVGHGPAIAEEAVDRLRAELAPVETERHLFGIAHHHDIDALPLAPRPGPMRGEADDGRIVDPLRAAQAEGGLGEAAQIENAEHARRGRPVIRCRLAVIIEAGPHEPAGDERAVGDHLPARPMRCAPACRLAVIGRRDMRLRVALERAARLIGAGVFGADDRLGRDQPMVDVILVLIIIKPGDIDFGRGVDRIVERAVHCDRHRPRRVEPFERRNHPPRHFDALRCRFERFLVPQRPDDDAGVVAIAPDEPFELRLVIG